MNIDRIDVNSHGIDNSPIDRSAEPGKSGKSNPTQSASTGEDSVALSSRARKVEQLASIVAGDRAERLAAVRAAIDNGTYRVSGEEIARKMIAANTK